MTTDNQHGDAKAAVADALRRLTASMSAELDAGRRSTNIDANDVIDLLLALADDLDPPFTLPDGRDVRELHDDRDEGEAIPDGAE